MMKTKVISVLASAMVITGLGIAPAQAKVVTNECRWRYDSRVAVKECKVRYNWFERSILLKRDGWEPQSIQFR